MIKKKFITLFLLFIFSIIRSQTNGTIIYKVRKVPDDQVKNIYTKNNIDYEETMQKFNKYYAIASQFNFILKFNNEESLYFWEEEMLTEDLPEYYLIRAKLLGGGMDKYYQNKISNVKITQGMSPFSREMEREKSSLYNNPKWKITEERDIILGYPVIKAIYKNVEVWFTPDITLPFGPAGYGGLPGLILKKKFIKQFPATEIVADKIIFTKDKIKIKKPKKGILRTKEAADSIRRKRLAKEMLMH